MPTEKDIVEKAVEAGILTQSGPHYYDAETEEHVGQGTDQAAEHLRSEGVLGAADTPDGAADTSGDEKGAEEKTSETEGYDAAAYRFEGDQRATFRREDRPDGYLYPGAVYNELPTGQDDIQKMIDEGILAPIE